jgi:hypothetical protein
MMRDPMTRSQINIINRFKTFLAMLGIKSARVSTRSILTGTGAVIKIGGVPVAFVEGITYDYNNISDLTDDGSND